MRGQLYVKARLKELQNMVQYAHIFYCKLQSTCLALVVSGYLLTWIFVSPKSSQAHLLIYEEEDRAHTVKQTQRHLSNYYYN